MDPAPLPWMYQWRPTAYAWAFGSFVVRTALARAIPMYVFAALLAGPLLDADVLDDMQRRSGFLAAAAVGWVLATGPARTRLFGSIESEYLRSLPVPRWLVFGALVLALLCLDAPWVWWCASSGVAGLAVAGPALTLAGHAAVSSRRRTFVVAAVGLFGVASVAPAWWVLAPALVLTAVALPWAYASSGPSSLSWAPALHVRIPAVGVARAILSAVVRGDAPVIRRTAFTLLVAVAVSVLVIRNNDIRDADSVARISLVVLTLAMPLVAIRLVIGAIRTLEQIEWLRTSTGTSRAAFVIGALLSVVIAGSSIGALHGCAVAGWSDRSFVLYPIAIGAVWGGMLAVVTLGVAMASVVCVNVEPFRLAGGVLATTVGLAFAVGSDLGVGIAVGAAASAGAALCVGVRATRGSPGNDVGARHEESC